MDVGCPSEWFTCGVGAGASGGLVCPAQVPAASLGRRFSLYLRRTGQPALTLVAPPRSMAAARATRCSALGRSRTPGNRMPQVKGGDWRPAGRRGGSRLPGGIDPRQRWRRTTRSKRLNLETAAVGRARVGCDAVRWQGATTLRARARGGNTGQRVSAAQSAVPHRSGDGGREQCDQCPCGLARSRAVNCRF